VAQRCQDPAFDLQHRILHRRLVPRLAGSSRQDGGAVVAGQLVVAGVEHRVEEVRSGDAALQVVGHQGGGHAADGRERPDMRGQPVLHPLGPGRLRIDQARERQAGHEDLCLARLAGVHHHDRVARVVDLQRRAGAVLLAQRHRAAPLPAPAAEIRAELGEPAAVGVCLDVLAPHQLQGQVLVPAQIPVHRRPVQQRPRLQPMAVIGALVQPLLQCPLVQVPDLVVSPACSARASRLFTVPRLTPQLCRIWL
jgi:hypothetical protein